MQLSRRQLLKANVGALGILAGCAGSPGDTPTESPETPTSEATMTPSPTAASTPTPSGLDGEITVKGSEWTLVPDAFQAKVGQELTIHFENVGEVTHNLTVGKFPSDEQPVATQDEEGTAMAKSDTIQPGKTTSVTFTPESTGTFPYWCDVPGHREAGMVGEMKTID